MPPLVTRNARGRLPHEDAILVERDDDVDDADKVQLFPSVPSSREISRKLDGMGESLALQAKERRRKGEASSAAHPETFYSRQSDRPTTRNHRHRPDGPIALEEPSDGRSNDREALILVVRNSPGVGPVNGSSHNTKNKPPASSRTRMVDRMHKKMPSPMVASTSQRRSLSSMAPSTLPTLPGSQLASPNDLFGSSRGAKRMRTEAGTTSSVLDDSSHSSPQILEVRLQAIVVSGMGRSRERDHAAVWVNAHSLQCGVAANHRATIRYSNIREVLTNTPDVKGCGILCLTLTPGCKSARELQKTFPDVDPCASGDAAQIQMVACDSSADDLSEPQEPQPRKVRTLITPGSHRPSESFTRGLNRTNVTYESYAPRKKTFDLQPPSPTASATLGRARNASPSLPSLTIPKAEIDPIAPPKVEVRRPPVSHENGTILQYPCEGTGAVSLRISDFDKLLDGGLLNDIAIDFGVKVILAEIRARDPMLADSIYVFNTFFFSILMSDSVENSYAKLRRWTVKEDLFAEKYVVIPVNEDYHWYLALIVHPAYIFADQHRDSNSEKDKGEVAASLMLPSPKSRRQSPALEQIADTERDPLKVEPRVEDKPAASSEPGAPPLPSTSVLPQTADKQPGSVLAPMAVDAKPCAALDEKKPPLSASASRPKPEARREPKLEDDAQAPASKSASKLYLAASSTDASEIQARESPGDPGGSRESATVAKVTNLRSVPVHDKRQANGAAAAKLTEAEASSKSLSKAAYINASVSEQPDFCGCRVYLGIRRSCSRR
ncbi:hypothetical protein PHSY_006396 [Pseudozyma hubeiensis SY62]|uniref:Ubiquitin-like protease family profile domain-containing protein n=1 Tax=Pseudozyma hubeiensis (strain SY62) TaxID=1305764 RepID=R9PBQ6_PSEHS|nr:hypothetical protein PHSY_006396 [Pseudozyma hubeiensis SY62]GAC98801.1 hypothetical protein PHSY_006396 [Pseudozyma hubeiensis SY62]